MAKKNKGWEQCFDYRNRRIRGLWKRNETFYVQVRLPGFKAACRFPIHDVTTVAEAERRMQAVIDEKRGKALEIVGQQKLPETVTLKAAASRYIEKEKALRKKSPGTLHRESSSLNNWVRFYGAKDLKTIDRKDVMNFARRRQEEDEVSGRAVDVDVIALKNVMRMFIEEEKYLSSIPFGESWEPLADDPKDIRLMEPEEVEQLCDIARRFIGRYERDNKGLFIQWEARDESRLSVTTEGQQFSDFLRFLSLTGGRDEESRHMTWRRIDFKDRKIEIGRSATDTTPSDPSRNISKNGKSRWVQMSPKLESLLLEMKGRKTTDLLFPSPRTGGVIVNYYKSLQKVKGIYGQKFKTDVSDVGFHHFRHYFASHAVMAGVDFKTVSEWLGHADGGMLVAKTYSHLNTTHKERMAERLTGL